MKDSKAIGNNKNYFFTNKAIDFRFFSSTVPWAIHSVWVFIQCRFLWLSNELMSANSYFPGIISHTIVRPVSIWGQLLKSFHWDSFCLVPKRANLWFSFVSSLFHIIKQESNSVKAMETIALVHKSNSLTIRFSHL